MDGSNKDKDVGLDDINADDGKCKVDLGNVHSCGGDSNDGGGVDDIGGVYTNGGDDANCGEGDSKVSCGDLEGGGGDGNNDGGRLLH